MRAQNKYLIIAGGGQGVRMNSVIPKQFICIAGLPVLFHTIHAFIAFDPKIRIILSLPEKYFSFWDKLCQKHRFLINHDLVPGGPTRFHSVKNALKLIHDANTVIAIHDGVRPLVSRQIIKAVFSGALKYGCAIPILPLKESVRELHGNSSVPVKRDQFYIVQTPQCFKSVIIKDAYKQNYRSHFTDDATVAETLGNKIHLVRGDEENIKITTQTDLKIAEILMKTKDKKRKTNLFE